MHCNTVSLRESAAHFIPIANKMAEYEPEVVMSYTILR